MIFALLFYKFTKTNTKLIKSYYIKSEDFISPFTKNLLENNNIIKRNIIDKNTLVLLCNYDTGKQEIESFKNTQVGFISGFLLMDYLVAKDSLYLILKKFYGEKVTDLLPKSYVLGNLADKETFLKEKQDNNIYIVKKNIQRQEGITILKGKSLESLDNLIKEKNVIIQEYLDNVYLINGFKINLRVYLLIISINSKTTAYIYDNGFLYYTQKKYDPNSINPETSITTGLQKDRRVYEENPLTIKDLEPVIGSSNYVILNDNIKILMEKVTKAYKEVLKGPSNYQIFGCDIQPDRCLGVKLIEINKNPSLDFKDIRDSDLKKNLQINIFKKLGINLETYNNDSFIELNI